MDIPADTAQQTLEHQQLMDINTQQEQEVAPSRSPLAGQDACPPPRLPESSSLLGFLLPAEGWMLLGGAWEGGTLTSRSFSDLSIKYPPQKSPVEKTPQLRK